MLEELHSERFVDCSPAQTWATLLDEGRYLASERTMYRLLAAEGETRERRNQLVHPPSLTVCAIDDGPLWRSAGGGACS
ncbi:MAG: hypothetical protein IIC35_08885 [Gemmatimonadetes bacterium]|nr:hypothetical protein [Gemmatimonadota bacterium]